MKSALRVYWKGYEVYWGSVTEDESKQAYREATIALAEGASLESIAASNPQMTEEALLRCEKAAKKLISIVASKESMLRGTQYVRVAPPVAYKQLQQPVLPPAETAVAQAAPGNDAEQNKDAGPSVMPVQEAMPAPQQLAPEQQ